MTGGMSASEQPCSSACSYRPVPQPHSAYPRQSPRPLLRASATDAPRLLLHPSSRTDRNAMGAGVYLSTATNCSNTTLLEQAAAGEQQAWDQLITRYDGLVRSVARSF